MTITTLALTRTAALMLAAVALPAAAGSVHTIDFEAFSHGEVLANSPTSAAPIYEMLPGSFVGLTVFNHTGPDLSVAFDSNLSNTRDPDLEGPNWRTGNLANANPALGKLLIVQENAMLVENRDQLPGVGLGDIVKADDEGSKPGGILDFFFPVPIMSFGFDLIDIEANSERDSGYTALLFSGNAAVGQINFSDLNSLVGANGSSGALIFGDNSANRVERQSIDAWTGGVASKADRVQFFFNGSGAIDNLSFSAAPSPTAAGIGLLGLASLCMRRRRRS